MNIDNKWYKIKRFSRYVINKQGVVYNVISNKIVTGSKNPAGYHNYRVTRDDGYTYTVGRHRLLGMVFIPCDVDTDTLVINHINGIKGDDTIENL